MNSSKIAFQDFIQLLSYDVTKNNTCIEVLFCVDNDLVYESCWFGKTTDKENTECYWYGLVEDGSQAYEFNTVDEFINAKIFRGKNIKEIWNLISLYSIDGCEVVERLSDYLA
jgi:hypothetical protein